MAYRIRLRARGNQHYIYSGRSLLVSNLDGWATGSGTEGFYCDNTRLLSRDELRVDGAPLRPASVSPAAADVSLGHYELPAAASIPGRSVYLSVGRRVTEGLRTELELTNYSRDVTAVFTLDWLLDADFADSDEAESGVRRQCAAVSREWRPGGQQLLFRYLHPSIEAAVALLFEATGPSAELEAVPEGLALHFTIPPRGTARLAVRAEPIMGGKLRPAPSRIFPAPFTGFPAARARLASAMPRLTTPNATVQRAWATATEDLASLPLGLEEGPMTPAAGFPLYQQFFGRDSLTISWQALLATPTLMRDSLLANAAWQGRKVDDFYDEQPGKLIHQLRWGPLSRLGLDAFAHYYGDWATPVDFLAMLGQYLAWTDDRETAARLLPAARRVLEWIQDYGDLDGDGFLEYRCRSPVGVKHQGWKDSDDAIVNARGQVVDPPLATCEVQGYWYGGLQQAGLAFLALGHIREAVAMLRQARKLRARFPRAYWMEREQFYAMALDTQGRQVDAISSNPGHLLITGIPTHEHAQAVARRLLQADMFSGWGVRTLSSDNPFYNPFSYHRGSVWPVEQGTIALGLARYGLWDELHTLAEAFFALADLFSGNRLPEVVSGLPREARLPHPGIYPYSCEPQGWSSSAVVMVMQALLGLHPVAPLHLLIVDPHLPAWLPELKLEGLRACGATIDLHCWRTKSGATRYRAHVREGRVLVVRQPPPNAPVRLGKRVRAAAASLVRR